MKCPVCQSTRTVEIDIHSDGYAKDLLECTACGTIWLDNLNKIVHSQKKAA